MDAGKQEREATQLSRFMRDYEKATSSAFAEATERGDDPPDFVVTRSSSSLGVELTQLVLPERIEAWETMHRSSGGSSESDATGSDIFADSACMSPTTEEVGYPRKARAALRSLPTLLSDSSRSASMPRLRRPPLG